MTASASASAGTSGATSGISGGKKDADTASAGYQKGMIVFTIAKGGLMYTATVAGQKFKYTPHPEVPAESSRPRFRPRSQQTALGSSRYFRHCHLAMNIRP